MRLAALEPGLAEHLASAGVKDLADPGEAWPRLHAKEGRSATLVDRYAIEAAARSITIDEMTEDDKVRLRGEVLGALYPGIELIGGPGRDPVEVVAYDPDWPRRFGGRRDRLVDSLGPVALRIDHIGSTSVPGLAAKPVVDVQVSVSDPEAEDRYVPAIEGLGVPLRAREPDHRYFRPPPGRPRDVQIHVCRSGSPWESDHLRIRDYLLANAAARSAYQTLKLELAERFHNDRLAYNESKTAFILDTLEAAEEWAAASGWTVEAGP